jgi:glucose/arabinose dehydrogenase
MNNSVKKVIINLILVLAGAGIIWAVLVYQKNSKEVEPVIKEPDQDVTEVLPKPGENKTSFPLKVPDNFSVEIFAKNLSRARAMTFDRDGNMWVSRTGVGIISVLEIKDGVVVGQRDALKNLQKPHGLATDPQNSNVLYFAEENKITRVNLNSDDPGQKIADLPTAGGGHFTRTLGFGPDDRLYVSIGSSCNVCNEADERRAAIYSMKKDGSDFKKFASGLRNTVFFTWSYVDGRMWGTDMGRDLLGDNLPPEEINVLEEGKNYGWPICYGNNIHDTSFDKNQYIQDPCHDKIPPKVEMQAHSAPLGLAFVPEEGWPEDYWYDLIVAFHGSWNRSERTGYKLVRIKLDSRGNVEGIDDFIAGWLRDGEVLGRPVDVLIQPGGIMYVSDDYAGVIYKISYQGNK